MRNFLPLRFMILAVCCAAQFSLAQDLGIKEKTLSNGLDVIVIENHAVPLATIEICVKNGAFTEPPEYNGLSHLYEHMFFKANESIPNQEKFLERTRELGMVWNGTTGNERVNYFFTLHKDNLKAGLEFMNAAIRTPLFDETELKKEREVVIGEYDRAEAQPFYHAFVTLNKKMWGEYYSRKNPLGERPTILSATRDKMLTIKNKFYVSNNSVLLVAGDINPDEIFKLAENIFGSWQRSEDPFIKNPRVEFKPLVKKEVALANVQIPVALVQLGYRGPDTKRDVKATYAADVFSFILRQPASRFQKNLLDAGLALNASIGYQTEYNVGPIYVSLVTQPNKLKEAVNALFAEMDKFDSPDYYTDEQLESAKTQLAVDELYSQESPSQWIHTVSYWWASAGLDYYLHYVENLKKVTRADINDYIQKYIKGKNYILGLAISEEIQKNINLNPEELIK